MWNSHPRGPVVAPLLSPRTQTTAREKSRSPRTAGFSLTELLIVLLIVTVLLGLLLPALASARASARQVQCASSLRQLQLTTRMYADSYRTLPIGRADDLIPALDLPAAVYRCRDDKAGTRVPLTHPKYSSFTYLATVYMDPTPDQDLTKLKPRVGLRRYENNPLLPIFWDRDNNHSNDRNVVYWNGVAQKRNWE